MELASPAGACPICIDAFPLKSKVNSGVRQLAKNNNKNHKKKKKLLDLFTLQSHKTGITRLLGKIIKAGR